MFVFVNDTSTASSVHLILKVMLPPYHEIDVFIFEVEGAWAFSN